MKLGLVKRMHEFGKEDDRNHLTDSRGHHLGSMPEVFHRAIAQMIEELEGVVNIIDSLVWGDSVGEHDHRPRLLFQKAKGT